MSQPHEEVPATLAWATRIAVAVLVMLVGVRLLNSAALFPRGSLDASRFETVAKSTPDTRVIHFAAVDGVKLYGWVCGKDEAPRKIVFCSGNGGNVSGYGPRMAEVARELNAQVLVFDYRGYYLSEGSPSEAGLYKDARGAWLFARRELRWNAAQTVIWGHSLGAAVATSLAHDLERDSDHRVGLFGDAVAASPAAALILECPFTSASDMARRQFGFLGVPHWLCYACLDNSARVAELKLPIFVFHGTSDEIIPAEMGREIASCSPKCTALWIEGGNHNGLWAFHREKIATGIGEFLNKVVR